MHIKFVEIQNFRKLKSIRIDFSEEKTLFVGANNSGKTSAMMALRCFLNCEQMFTPFDFTLCHLQKINKIGERWDKAKDAAGSVVPSLLEWVGVLPCMDVWIHVENNEIHHVNHLLPTLDWAGGSIGIRLRLEPKILEEFYEEYVSARKAAQKTIDAAKLKNVSNKYTVDLWPANMCEFLDKRMSSVFSVRAYSLDPAKLLSPDDGVASPQVLPEGVDFIEGNPFKGLVRIDVIDAQRGFSDPSTKSRTDDVQEGGERISQGRLSEQLRAYYKKHIDPSEMPEPSDVDALEAICLAQKEFDVRLEAGFRSSFKELEELNYPGVMDPKLAVATKIRPVDGLTHSSALQYEVLSKSVDSPNPLRLPEQYNGLGYQNLISIAFRLMSFRDEWMQVGKVGKKATANVSDISFPPPLHLVLIEEPEAHLHAQVQQVFIRKAYDILRAHEDLGANVNLRTQLVVTTHSSHIAHECSFSSLRYFRRLPSVKEGEVPTTTVINLSEIFGPDQTTEQFVTRYLKTIHCDLFFADAAILVEGPAERMLVPHFIREHFEQLRHGYVTLLEIGGSHAHRLRPLIEHLGLITLVVSDIDAMASTGVSTQPLRHQGQTTRSATLKKWWPNKETIDDLLDLQACDKIKEYNSFFSVRVAYQCPIRVQIEKVEEEALPYTFEDALVLENLSFFKDLEGDGLIKKFKEAINKNQTVSNMGKEMFESLKTGNKAEFALDLLYLREPKTLKVPTYINEGLMWLDEQLKRKQQDSLSVTKVAIQTLEATKT